jgi:hypothetical protein
MSSGSNGIESTYGADFLPPEQKQSPSDPLGLYKNQAESIITDSLRHNGQAATAIQDAIQKLDLLARATPDPQAKTYLTGILEALQKTDPGQFTLQHVQGLIKNTGPSSTVANTPPPTAFYAQNPFAAKPLQNANKSGNDVKDKRSKAVLQDIEDNGLNKLIRKVKRMFS